MHLDTTHAVVNLAALAVTVALAWRQRMLVSIAAAALIGMPLLSLTLLQLDLTLQWYAGLSGLLHGLLVMVLLRRGGVIAWALLLLVALKLAYEWRYGSRWDGFAVVTLAHRLGAAWGLIGAVAAWAPGRVRYARAQRG